MSEGAQDPNNTPLDSGEEAWLEKLAGLGFELAEGLGLPTVGVDALEVLARCADDEARRILRAGSIFGEVFWEGAVARAWVFSASPSGVRISTGSLYS